MYYPQLNIKHDGVSAGFLDINKARHVIMRNTLNVIVSLVRRNEINNIKSDFTLRNNYTIRNIGFDKATKNNLVASVGVRPNADYMRIQEFSGKHKPKRGNRLAIPQLASRNNSKRRPVDRNVYLRSIKKKTLNWTHRKGSRKSALIAMAAKSQSTGMFFNYKKNIYQVTSFTKSRGGVKFRKKHLYNVSQQYTRVKKTPHLQPALKQPVHDAQRIFESQTRKLLKQKYIV